MARAGSECPRPDAAMAALCFVDLESRVPAGGKAAGSVSRCSPIPVGRAAVCQRSTEPGHGDTRAARWGKVHALLCLPV